jgi:hypothetical protein
MKRLLRATVIRELGLFYAVLATMLLLWPAKIRAFELAAGIAGVEEGDDRYRPASSFHLGIGDRFHTRAYLYGRKHGPFTEQSTVSSFNYRFPLTGSKSNFSASVGATILAESTSFKAQNETEESESDTQWNLGAAFGLSYVVPLDHVYLSLNWDAHLYLAGSAGVLFATGRKHLVGIATGVKF